MGIKIIKNIIYTFAIAFLGAYLSFFIIFSVSFLLHTEPLLGSDLPNYLGWLIFISIWPLIFAPFITIALFIFSLFDKRFLNKWFVLGFSAYSFIANFIIKNLWYSVGFVLISLVIIFIFMNIKKWIKSEMGEWGNGGNEKR